MAELPAPGSKRRRLRGSCDICKQRKVRCDSSVMPNNRCSNCIAFNSECTHSNAFIPKAPESSQESRNKTPQAHVDAIVSQSTSYIAAADIHHVLLLVSHYARSLEKELSACRRSHSSSYSDSSSSPPTDHLKNEAQSEDDDLFVNGVLTERFERFILDSDRNRFFGKSSHVELIKAAIDVKKQHAEDEVCTRELLPPTRRPQFWDCSWEHEHFAPKEVLPPLIFPEGDLLQSLVSIYFARVNILFGLLHRPTFEKGIAAGLHFVDRQFGSTVLAVCAVAAKHSDDPRVLLHGTDTTLSAGWRYFRQLQPIRTRLTKTATLYEIQLICMYVLYLQGSSVPEGCWPLAGAGVRYAQDVGVHRKNRYDDRILDEQWKRAFWCLITIDTLASTICGRPRATCSSDYDLDYPVECDDEFWEPADPSLAFKQPPGKPSVMTHVVMYMKLIEIIGMAQQTIYSVRKEKKPEGWIQGVVEELDSALNTWIDSMPDHLRWDPYMEDPIFAAQSATLYACYYQAQIQVHRLFVTNKTSPSHIYPSLAICANSARCCSHVMDVASRRLGYFLGNPHVLNAIFDSGVFLLMNVFQAGRLAGHSTDPQKCLQDLETCLRILGMYECRWQVAGRQHDMLTELMSAMHVDWPIVPNPLKRGRQDDYGEPPPITNTGEPDLNQIDAPSFDYVSHAGSQYYPDIDLSFTLPMHSEDLGRLPVYEPFNWEGTSTSLEPPLPSEFEQPHNISGLPMVASNQAHLYPTPDYPHHDPALLTEIPPGYDWEEWAKYLSSVQELMHPLDG
ncbi:fungal-specific transcription factor domain-containing protein [Mycena rebaudengoi]|nr:fungal-specific transcription factor domain-containing protein [Mycena rebaudengoi]